MKLVLLLLAAVLLAGCTAPAADDEIDRAIALRIAMRRAR
jgi:uncharacterized lipoprotein YajG